MSGMLPLASGPAFGVAVCWNGDAAAGERVIAPLRRLGKPLTDTVRPLPYLEIQSLLSPPPIRVSSYARSSFLAELSDGAIDLLAARATSPSPVMCVFFMEHLHGRASAFGPGDSAFVHRTPGHNFAVLSMWMEPGDAEAATAHARSFFSDLSPFLAQGVYANYLADEGEARVRAAYGAAWGRLVELKRKYDPENVFRLNQNVSPSG
jgi:FAD/FMN-containing dehydrogenase